MKQIFVILAMLTLSAAAQDIQHAPTAAQCQADIAVWKPETKADIEALPVNTLVGRANELSDCAHVLNGDGWSWARTIRKAYDEHIENRDLQFLFRHGLVQQMVDEDAKGALTRTINYRFRERYVLGGLLSGGSSFSADRARVYVRMTGRRSARVPLQAWHTSLWLKLPMRS